VRSYSAPSLEVFDDVITPLMDWNGLRRSRPGGLLHEVGLVLARGWAHYTWLRIPWSSPISQPVAPEPRAVPTGTDEDDHTSRSVHLGIEVTPLSRSSTVTTLQKPLLG